MAWYAHLFHKHPHKILPAIRKPCDSVKLTHEIICSHSCLFVFLHVSPRGVLCHLLCQGTNLWILVLVCLYHAFAWLLMDMNKSWQKCRGWSCQQRIYGHMKSCSGSLPSGILYVDPVQNIFLFFYLRFNHLVRRNYLSFLSPKV